MTSKAGYLRYKCSGCSAIIKIDVQDVMAALAQACRSFTPVTHQCDETHVNIATLIGGTFNEPQEEAG